MFKTDSSLCGEAEEKWSANQESQQVWGETEEKWSASKESQQVWDEAEEKWSASQESQQVWDETEEKWSTQKNAYQAQVNRSIKCRKFVFVDKFSNRKDKLNQTGMKRNHCIQNTVIYLQH